MLTIASTIFATCLGLFLIVATVVQIEESRGTRLILNRFRTWLDESISYVSIKWQSSWSHFTQYVVKLGWYYSIHSLLQTILRVLVSAYSFIEHVFEKNRARTKKLRHELKKASGSTHLIKIAAHKSKSALTAKEQDERRKQKLEYDH